MQSHFLPSQEDRPAVFPDDPPKPFLFARAGQEESLFTLSVYSLTLVRRYFLSAPREKTSASNPKKGACPKNERIAHPRRSSIRSSRTLSARVKSTPTQMMTKASSRLASIGSPRSRPMRNCKVGLTYMRMPVK